MQYTNQTGRNDIKRAKVALSGNNLAFLVQTSDKLSAPTTGDWMTLYIDADQNAKTGWMGYDARVSPASGTIELNLGNAYQWQAAQKIAVKIGDNQISFLVPRKYLQLAKDARGVDFKWTDNCYEKGDWSDFMLNGDAAP